MTAAEAQARAEEFRRGMETWERVHDGLDFLAEFDPVSAMEVRSVLFDQIEAEEEFRRRQRSRARAGVAVRRDNRARASEALSAHVEALRARHPTHSTRAIARLLLRADQRGDRRAIERIAARLRRLARR